MKQNNEIKKAHNEAYENIKPSVELIDKTFELMKNESRKEKRDYSRDFKKKFKPMASLACALILIIGINFYSKIDKDNFNIQQSNEINGGADSPQSQEAPRKINISGVIEEVKDNGSKFKIDGKWISIDKNTEFLIDDNGIEIVHEFKVGNYVEGWTYDDMKLPEVKADYIYINNEK